MKILLLNNNPVVSKLVTLSANKTSDELDNYESIEDIEAGTFDLLVVDDSLYSEDILVQLKENINYSKSLYIHSKNAPDTEGFDVKLKKPFLPTDLVEMFSVLGKEANSIELENDDLKSPEDVFSLDDDLSLDDELNLDDLGDELNLDDEISLDDDELNLDLDLDLDDELSLDGEDISLDNDLNLDDDITSEKSILDEEEVQEVQNLLDETTTKDELSLDLDELPDDEDLEDTELSLDDEEISLDEEKTTVEDELAFEDDFSLDEESEIEDDNELSLDEESEIEDDNGLSFDEESEIEDDNELSFDEESEIEDDNELSFDDEEIEPEEDLEAQIESALDELSEEDLESEVDEETLVELASSAIDSIDALNMRDLKLALGEDVSEYPEEEKKEVLQTKSTPSQSSQEVIENSSSNDGIEALKNLLLALSDKNVAASLKGMNISINITLGDK